MAASTLLTLLVIPVVYTLLAQLQAWVLRVFHYDRRQVRAEAVV